MVDLYIKLGSIINLSDLVPTLILVHLTGCWWDFAFVSRLPEQKNKVLDIYNLDSIK